MADQDKQEFIDRELEERKKENRLRSLVPYTPGPESMMTRKGDRDLINFCSNDYLGLSNHPRLIAKSNEFTRRYGTGSVASRLISGTYDIHDELEKKLASALERSSALLFNSGFQANSTIIGTLAGRHSLVLADKLSHNSLLQGSLLSRATLQRFEHNDMDHLNSLLSKALNESYDKVLIITETVFSMDGDRADLDSIISLADRYNALLFVDDAHAVGVWGEDGWGLGRSHSGIDILLGTCGKALGSFGAYAACTSRMKEYLVNYCPGFIYTTSLPPSIIGAVTAAVDMIPDMGEQRRRLRHNSSYMRAGIQQLGYKTGRSSSQIIPVIIGDEQQTIDLSERLEDRGILATAIRPPTVPENSSRIRITISADHKREHLDLFLNVLERWNRE